MNNKEILHFAWQGVIAEMDKLTVQPTVENMEKYGISKDDEDKGTMTGIITDEAKYMELYKKQDWLWQQLNQE